VRFQSKIGVAKQLQLKFTGLLGVLLKAKQQHVIASVSDVLIRLKQANFRVSQDLEKEVLNLAGE
jgi:predicted nucleic acid-binding protein